MRLLILTCLLLFGSGVSSSDAQTPPEAAQTEKAKQPDKREALKKAAEEFFREEQGKATGKGVARPATGPSKDQNPQPKGEPSPQPSAKAAETPGEATVSGGEKEKADTGLMPEPPGMLFDDSTQKKYLAAMSEYYDYRLSGFQHRRRVFEWQLLSSKIIFVVVIGLVLVGVYFSWVQFRSSFKPPYGVDIAKKKEDGETVSVEREKTELEASLSGIRISSPILGVIILIISFLFFYLYLAHVYPISEIL
jgi:cobalamin biosynthesis Mg chelatase CobN